MNRSRMILYSALALLVAGIAALVVLDDKGEAAEGQRDLDAILVFSHPADCRTAEPLTRIVRELNRQDPEFYPGQAATPIQVPGYAEPLRPHRTRRFAIGRDAMGFVRHAVLDLGGRWHGLRVTSLRSGSGENDLTIHFADQADHVRQVLVRNGFDLPAAGQWRQPNYAAETATPMMGVQAQDGGATLYCSN